MQVVIDIPESTYKDAMNHFPEMFWSVKVSQAIRNGTPLPKHGRLIDADALIKHVEDLPKLPNGHSKEYDEARIISIIDKDTSTIIPADKAESEEKE